MVDINIQINLYKDWIDNRVEYIALLKKQGFIFPEYEKWKPLRISELEKRKESYNAENRSVVNIEKMLKESSLIFDFKTHIIFSMLNHQYRLIEPLPREIIRPKNFHCQDNLKKGLKFLENKIVKGVSLFPHLSRQIFDSTQQDGLLYDWGIHHFHLGTKPDPKNKYLIKGDSHILYAVVKPEKIFFLKIDNHKHFADKELLLILKRNYPELISPYKMSSMNAPERSYSEKEQKQLRKAGACIITEIDGECYMPIGGGINSAGGSGKSVPELQQIIYWLEQAEKIIIENLNSWANLMSETKLKVPKIMNLKMDYIDNRSMTLRDHEWNIKIILKFTDNRFEDIKIEHI